MDSTTPLTTAVKEAIASVPPAGVTAWMLFGMPAERWVLILTLFWLTLQIGHFIVTKIIKPLRQQNDNRSNLPLR